MRRFVVTVLCFCAFLVVVAPSAADEDGRVFTLPGVVEFFDLENLEITIEGMNLGIAEDVVVLSEGTSVDLTHVSQGDFVIATVQGNTVKGLTLVPPGRGF